MARLHRSFSTKFKYDAARLIVEHGYSVSEASRSFGVEEAALKRWVKQFQNDVTPRTKALTADQQRIQELEARVNRLERERAILRELVLV